MLYNTNWLEILMSNAKNITLLSVSDNIYDGRIDIDSINGNIYNEKDHERYQRDQSKNCFANHFFQIFAKQTRDLTLCPWKPK